MGLFTTIGSFFGPVGTALGAVGDGIMSHKSKKKETQAQNALEMDKFVRLREASERGGFHPLETLRAGGQVQANAAPRLYTSLSQSNAFDALENEISGEGAKARERQRIDDEIQARELERLEIANAQMTQPTVRSNTPFRPPLGSQGGAPRRPSTPPFIEPGKDAPRDDRPDANLDHVERGPDTVTGSRDLTGQVYNDPTRGDFSMVEERKGDSEIVNAPMIAEQWYNDWNYNQALYYTAEELNMSTDELHQAIIDDPALRAELPGLLARTSMDATKLAQYLSKKLQRWSDQNVKPARLPSWFDPSFSQNNIGR